MRPFYSAVVLAERKANASPLPSRRAVKLWQKRITSPLLLLGMRSLPGCLARSCMQTSVRGGLACLARGKLSQVDARAPAPGGAGTGGDGSLRTTGEPRGPDCIAEQ